MERPRSALTAPAANNPRTCRRYIATLISHLLPSDHETCHSFFRPDAGGGHGVAARPVAFRRSAHRRIAYGGGRVRCRRIRTALRAEDLHVARNASADADEVRGSRSHGADEKRRA